MEPDSPAAPQDFCIHHWAEEMVLRNKLIKFTDRYQSILWFSETVGSQVAFRGQEEVLDLQSVREKNLVESTFSTTCNHPEVWGTRGKSVCGKLLL